MVIRRFGSRAFQPLRLLWAGGLALLLTAGDPAPSGAQPGAQATIDQAVLAMPAGAWVRLGSQGTPETARYALYQYREPVRLLLHWQPRDAMNQPPPGPAEEILSFADRIAHASGRILQEPLESAGEHRGHTVFRGVLYDLDVPAGQVLIWDCPQSGRLIAAELGLDLIWEVDQAWMPILEAMASTVGCHGPIRPASSPPVPLLELARFDSFRLGFRIPEGWRSGVLDAGSTGQAGSLWCVPSESVGLILVRRRDDREGELRDFLHSTLEMLPVVLGRQEVRTIVVLPGDLQMVEGSWYTEGTFRVSDPEWPWIQGEHRFALQAFNALGEQHALMVSWRAESDVRDASFDTGPSWERIRHWLDRIKRGYRP